MDKDTALRLALEALETSMYPQQKQLQAITAIEAALEAKDEIDWKDMYEKEKRRSEMWVAKYEKDIGPLEKAGPQQEAKDEPVAFENWLSRNCPSGDAESVQRQWESSSDYADLYTTPPPVVEPHKRKPLTDEEIWKFWWNKPEIPEGEDDSMEAQFVAACRRAIEAAHGIKGEA